LFLNFVNYCRSEGELAMLITAAVAPLAMKAVANQTHDFGVYLGFGPADKDVMYVPDWLDNWVDAYPAILDRWMETRVGAAALV
jgi:hypothetical protein